MLEVIKRHPKEIVLSAFARMGEQAPFYIFTAFVFSYATGTLGIPRDFLLVAVLTASIVSFVSIPLFGHISDRIGRKRMYLIGAATTGVFGFIYFGLFEDRLARAHLPRRGALAHSTRHDVWATGGINRRILHRSAPL